MNIKLKNNFKFVFPLTLFTLGILLCFRGLINIDYSSPLILLGLAVIILGALRVYNFLTPLKEKPFTLAEYGKWEKTRIKGRKRYLTNSIIRDSIYYFLLIVCVSIFEYFHYSVIFSFRTIVLVFSGLYPLYFFAIYNEASSSWVKNEKRYSITVLP